MELMAIFYRLTILGIAKATLFKYWISSNDVYKLVSTLQQKRYAFATKTNQLIY
jgi:hypothetical protein